MVYSNKTDKIILHPHSVGAIRTLFCLCLLYIPDLLSTVIRLLTPLRRAVFPLLSAGNGGVRQNKEWIGLADACLVLS